MSLRRQTMGLASKEDLQEIKVTHLSKRAKEKKKELIDAIKDNNQGGAFQEIESHEFQAEFKAGILCNFPITITKFWGDVPKPPTTFIKSDPKAADIPQNEKSSKSIKKKIKESLSDKLSIKKAAKDSPPASSTEQLDTEPEKKSSVSDVKEKTTKEDKVKKSLSDKLSIKRTAKDSIPADSTDQSNTELEKKSSNSDTYEKDTQDSEIESEDEKGNSKADDEKSQGSAAQTTIPLPEEHYLVLEPQWSWNKEYLTYTVLTEKKKSFKSASPTDNYEVSDYCKKVSTSVLKLSLIHISEPTRPY